MSSIVIGCIFLTLLILSVSFTNKKIKFWTGLFAALSLLLYLIPGYFWGSQNSIEEFENKNIDSIVLYNVIFDDIYRREIFKDKSIISDKVEITSIRYELEHAKFNYSHPETFSRAKVYIWSQGKKLILEIKKTDQGIIILKDANRRYKNDNLEKFISFPATAGKG